ncbi:MAG TPA: plasmid pRiA4b ORF-3 family protein [bacterium]|nr:plasmid pRiA4b ORF-3 family protein [bacterium]
MLIQCTKALLGRIKIPSGELLSPGDQDYSVDSVTAWHANITTIDRRKVVVLMNNVARYPVVIYRPKPKDFSRLKGLITDAIATALRMEGIREDVIENYLGEAGEIRFSKTANRRLIARMNNAVREVGFMAEHLDEDTLIQRYISMSVGRLIQSSPADEAFYPIEKMIECLGKYAKGELGSQVNILDVELYQLTIQIKVEGFDIWRRVLVPSTFSFRHLHNIIQTVFDWQDYHLHIFEAKKKGTKTKQIVMNDDPETLEWLDFDQYDILQERFTALKDIFPSYRQVHYEYDFGDSWQHIITLEKTERANEFRASYLGGKGERPPEDVGSTDGYQEYMRIMADPTDPEYENMKMWAESQKERQFSLEEMNLRLGRKSQAHYFYWR